VAADLNITTTLFSYSDGKYMPVITSMVQSDGTRSVGSTHAHPNADLDREMPKGGIFTMILNIHGSDYICGYEPLYAADGKTMIGVYFMGVQVSQVFADINAETQQFILIIISIAVAILLVSVLLNIHAFRRLIMKPIKRIIVALQKVEKGDVSASIGLPPGDEIGTMAASFDATLKHLSELVTLIKSEADSLDEIGGELSSSMDSTASASAEIASTIESIQMRASEQASSVAETNHAMDSITEAITNLNNSVVDMNSAMNRSQEAIQSMLSNIETVTEVSRANSANVKALAESSGVGRQGLQAVDEDIKEIAKQSAGLMEINGVIQNIATQTNLLSMNAAIEAAHAGESGRGFAVVADEIRKLSESSSLQSKTINDVLKKIKSSISQITDATSSVLEKFALIDSAINTVSEQEQKIFAAMEGQSSGSHSVLEAMQTLEDLSGAVFNSAGQMQEKSSTVITEEKKLDAGSKEIAASMNEMASRANDVDKSVQHLDEISRKNRQNINSLRQAVSQFVLEEKPDTRSAPSAALSAASPPAAGEAKNAA
jgi:methyl-accepting chemotaxis protein